MKKKNKILVAKFLEVVARKAVEVSVNERCMYILHQPRQPEGVKKFKK